MFLCWEVYMSVNYIKDGAICFAILVHNVYRGINSLQNLDKIEFVQIFLSRRICFLQDKSAKMNVDKEVIWKETCMVWWAGRPDNQAKMKDCFNLYLSNTSTTACYQCNGSLLSKIIRKQRAPLLRCWFSCCTVFQTLPWLKWLVWFKVDLSHPIVSSPLLLLNCKSPNMCSTLLDKVLREPTRARVCLFHNSLPTLYQLHPKVSLQNVQYLILKPNQSCYFVWSIFIKQNPSENLRPKSLEALVNSLWINFEPQGYFER